VTASTAGHACGTRDAFAAHMEVAAVVIVLGALLADRFLTGS
jgi:hypothetical protein